MASLIEGVTYAILPTDDMPRARQFFTEKLGLSTEDDQGDIFSQFTTRAGTMWAIVSRPSHAVPRGVELYLEVTDVDEAFRTWTARGVETITEPADAPFGRTFAFKDADGRVLHAWAPLQGR
ncbi:MAG: VOC family protein [Chloroflexi bacterium]|nr:VOC family protein [Chloroflexota bacterium]